jgi:molybdopterin-binding protein
VPTIGHPPRQAGKLRIDSLRVELEETVQISARNTLQGKVKRVTHGAVNTEVTVALPGGTELVSIITKVSAERLGLVEGKAVYVVIKASDVMIATE